MNNLDYYISLYLFFISCFMFSFYYKHLLLTIISLEFMMINIIFNMYMLMLNIESSIFLIIFMLIMAVCEGALSLSLIILMVRMYGNDYINILSLMKW